jgi:hypothetical protein
MAIVLHIEATFDSLLYIQFVVIILVHLLTIMQLFAPVIATLMSLVAIAMTAI